MEMKYKQNWRWKKKDKQNPMVKNQSIVIILTNDRCSADHRVSSQSQLLLRVIK